MANLNINKAILGGRIASDLDLKYSQSGVAVLSFAIAVTRKFRKEGEEAQSDFIDCTAWRGTAEIISKYFRKGSSIMVVGSIQKHKWQDADGNNRWSTEVIVDETYFVDSKNDAAAASAPAPAQSQAPAQMAYVPDQYKSTPPQFEEVAANDELPF